MRQKLHSGGDVERLLNAVMPWAEAGLREAGRIRAGHAWLMEGDGEAHFEAFPSGEDCLPIQEQESLLAGQLQGRWQRGELTAVALVAPVFYGRAGSGERSMAVRLHVENRSGYCADIFMPYRIRASHNWRGEARNRVHFSHPVAQESESLFNGSRQDGNGQGPAQDPAQDPAQGRMR